VITLFRRLRLLALIAAALSSVPQAQCAPTCAPAARYDVAHAPWTRNASLYEINLRQFTREGTLRAAQAQLPRLKTLGVDILWLMPIHPIGEAHRKGALGSPYAVRDFMAVNPEFGTLDDLKRFVAEAHRLGLHVILDWVGNHTSWDNVLVAGHPDWYDKNAKGEFRPTPWFDWDDIIELDYDKPGLQRYMLDALKYWVTEADIDGYRVDAAGFVPLKFWEDVRCELAAVKPVFMLAEWEGRDMHEAAFDASYAWSWWDGLRNIVNGKGDIGAMNTYYAWARTLYPKQAVRMMYTTNHDKNAWEGTEYEIFGPALESITVFSFVSEGIPLIYNGQEAGNRKRLQFFDRDPIEWKPSPNAALYTKLLALKKGNTALWNGQWGATMEPIANDAPQQVLSFVRANAQDKVFAVFNLSAKAQKVRFRDDLQHGSYRDFKTGETVRIDADTQLALAPWSYRVFVR
jgi:1,4-alpha-glucan branching enzyme